MYADPRTGLHFIPEDLSMRLEKSLISYKTRPFFVLEIANERSIFLFGKDTRSRKPIVVRLPSVDLNIRPVPLGYVNGVYKSWYVRRSPERKYKQGLSASNIRIKGPEMAMTRDDFIQSVGLSKCVLNEYPSFENALSYVRKNGGQRAFSRRFCIVRDEGLASEVLAHRGQSVGTIVKGRPVLTDNYQYLEQELGAVL